MCEYSEKLVAWMDRELPGEEASLLARHLDSCPECYERVSAYEKVDAALADYCESLVSGSRGRRTGWRLWAGAGAGAVAAGLLLMALLPYGSGGGIVGPAVLELKPPAIALEKPPAIPAKTLRRRAGKARGIDFPAARPDSVAQVQEAPRPLPEVEIAVPADALYPPGAVPAGFQFVAAVSIGADGSAQSLRLLPY
jgi:hypothetical protein